MKWYRLLGLGAVLGLPACGGEGLDSAEMGSPGELEDIGVAEQSLYDETCWTQAWANAAISTQWSTWVDAVSPDASYHQDSCPVQWVVDIYSVYNKAFSLRSGPVSQYGAPEDWCPGFWSYTKVKGWKPGQGWMFLTEKTQTGSWGPDPWAPPWATPYCRGTSLPDVGANHGFTQLRLVVQGGFASAFTPVRVGVRWNGG